MYTAKESQTCQQFSAWNSPDLGPVALLQLEQNYRLPCFPPSKLLTPNWDVPYPTGNPFMKGPQCGLPQWPGVTDKQIDASYAPQKRFLIFDQTGDRTRLFFSPFSPQNQIIAPNTPASASGPCEKVAARVDQHFLMKPIVEEKWDENRLTDGEGEMLEDTEEINALFYSDSDDEYDDDDDADGENDEVTSTGHSPFGIEEGYVKDKLLEELTEEVASSDGSPKRQRLLDGNYKKPSLVSAESPVDRAISCTYEDDVESSCAGDRNSYDDDIDSSKREKKVKIRQALKILESIIPELNSKDPLSIIDKAIAYLKSMKTEAEALGLS